MILVLMLQLTGHAECVRFVKKFNLPLLVGFREIIYFGAYLCCC